MKKVLLTFMLVIACSRSELPTELQTEAPNIFYPISNFETGITLKPFGIYVSPKNSPVQPERFTGFHTAVDIEVDQTDTEIPIYAIANGTVKISKWASGYGGVMVIEHEINSAKYTAIYGHVAIKSVSLKVGDTVKAGQQIAVLGTGYSKETDNERANLHFGIIKGPSTNILGYVQNETDLAQWIDPIPFMESLKPSIPN